jgi:hypothetical protein
VHVRPWYKNVKASGVPIWTGLAPTVSSTVTDTFVYPVYDGDIFIGTAVSDVVTYDLNLLQGIQSTDYTVYIYETIPDSKFLVAVSNGETVTTSTAAKKVSQASSPIIRDSYNFLTTQSTLPSPWTSGQYTGSDGNLYQLHYHLWDDTRISGAGTATHQFSCVVVKRITSFQTDAVTGLLGVIANVNVSLSNFMQTAIDVSSAVAFQTGRSLKAPLDTPLIERDPQIQGLTQQAMWATMQAYTTNAETSRAFTFYVGFSNKAIVKYEKYKGSYQYYYSGVSTSGTQKGYTVNANGTINAPNGYTSANYDPTTRSWYTIAKKSYKQTWTGFYNILGPNTYGVLSFAIPYYSLNGSTLEGVVATTRCLSSSTSGEESFASVLQAFQSDPRASVVYIMTTSYRLVATSFNEITWNTNSQTLKFANQSDNTFVAQTASYLSSIWSNTTNQYSVPFTNADGSSTFVYCTTLPWVDGTASLQLNIVAVSQPIGSSEIPVPAPVPAPVSSDNSDSEVAANAATAAAVFSAFIFFGGLVYVYMNKGGAGGVSTPMAGSKSSSA